jgi:autotransporter-associated beta strand protein
VTVNVFEDNGGVPGPLVDSLSFPTQPANQNFGEVIFTPEPLGTPGENSVTLLSSSTINLNPGAPGTLEDLHVSVIAELHVIAPSGGDLNFLGATTLDATASFTQSGSPVVTLNTVSGAGGITQNGDGTLFLPTENTYAGTTVINSGQIFADNGDALGDPAQGTTVQPTAALLFARGTFAEPLTLGSVGNTTVRGGLRKLPGANVVWTGPIDATTNALIYSSGDLLTLEGGITLTPNATLDVDAQNQILVQNEGIKGDPTTLLRFEGNDRTRLAVTSSNFLGNVEVFNNGRLQLEADGALGDNAGTTRITSGEASLVLRDSITQIETLEIFGDGRGTEGAIRNLIGDNTIQGTITLSAATELVIQAGSTLTLDGPLLGGVDLIQRQTGTLVLTHDNELTDFNLIGGGTTRIQSEGALGDTPVAVVDAGETLEFDGDLQFNGTTNLLQITANGGTISSFSGTTTVDIPVNAGANISYRFGGAGNLLITQPFGNGPGATTNELIKTDSGEVNLSAANTYNGDTTIINGTLIASHNDALGAPTANLVLFSSGTLELQGGIDVMRDEILFDGTGASNRLGALASSGGINTLTATAFMAQPFSIGDVRIAAVDGSFTLNGSVEMEHARLSTAGAGDIQFTGSISGPGGLFSPEARFVQVQKNIPGRLHIGELEVYAPGTAAVNDDVPGANTPLNNPDDLALTSQGATTYSASAGDGHGVPASVIDGLEQTAAATWTSDQGLTAPTAEITIDLGITSAIDTIRLHQRNDSCCQDRLENFTVNLFADDGGVPGILISSQVFPGRPPVNSFGEMTFTSTVTNSYNKTGTGTVTFSSPNFYGGGSAVQEGILIANGNPAVGSASVVADNGGTLSGTGTISSNVVIGTRGSISPGASTGVLPIGGELVFTNASSVYIAEIENPFTGDFDRLTVTGDIDLNDATLDLRRIPGYSSTLSDTVVLATYGGSLTGTFNGLPEGSLVSAEGEAFTISYLGGMIQLIATGTSHVYAGPDTISRQGTNGVTISTAELLLNDQIGIGPGPLSVTAVSAMGVSGGTITLNSNTVTYTPPPGYTGNDSFSYTITDGTDTTMGLVTVRVTEVPIAAPAVGNPSGLEKLPGGEYRIAFTGTAGATYTVQRALDLTATPSVTWTDVETVVADQDGNIIVEDPAPPEGIVYYRAIAD